MANDGHGSRVQRLLDALIRRRRPVAYVLFALTVLLLLAGALLGSKKNPTSSIGYGIDWDYWPEAAGSIVVALIVFGAGLWLVWAAETEARPTNARIMVLATGGLVGMTIALAAGGRAIRWWNVIFTGGLEAWQSPEGWRLWACILAEMCGLAIMFASLLLAKTEERSNPVLRRLLYGYNAALSGLLLLAILVVGNILVYAYFPATYTWTQTRGITELSDRSKRILRSLKKDAHVYVIMAQGSRVYPMVRTLLDNCQTVTDKIKVKAISPDLESKELQALKDRFPSFVVSGRNRAGLQVTAFERGVLIVYGIEDNAGQRTMAFIPETKLFEGKRRPNASPAEPGQTLVFKGEDAIFTELNFLTEDQKKPRIYITQDNGEPDLSRDLGALRKQLERNKFSVTGLRLREPTQTFKSDDITTVSKEVPQDAEVVVVVNPVEPFSKTALAALRGYMTRKKRKGKLLALVDFDRRDPRFVAIPKSGLEKLLAEFNVEVEPSFLLRDNREDQDDPRKIPAFPVEDGTNRIALAMPKKALLLPLVRPVRSLGQGRNYHVEPILDVPANRFTYWKEANLRAVTNPDGALKTKVIDRVKPEEKSVDVAVGVKDTRDDTPRLVVVGNMDMATDPFLLRDPKYYDFLENCLQWLRGKGEKLGIKPVESNRYTLNAEDINLARMLYLPLWLMAVAIVGLGTGIWLVRRR